MATNLDVAPCVAEGFITSGLNKSKYRPQRNRARKLYSETGGKFCVYFAPNVKYDDDDASMGRLYLVFPDCHVFEGAVYVDDRKPESLKQQLAVGLRELAAELLQLAGECDDEAAQQLAGKAVSR